MAEVFASVCDCTWNPLDTIANQVGRTFTVTVRQEDCDDCGGTVYLFQAVA